MKYTFGQAKRLLTGVGHSTAANVATKINDAIQSLCGANAWEHEFLRQTVRLTSATPVISLPQGSAGLVRACVNGRPSTMRGRDFQFLSSGPGDLSRIPPGFGNPLGGGDILDLGTSPVWRQPVGFGWLCAAYSGDAGQPPVHIAGTGMYGDRIEFDLNVQSDAHPLSYDTVHPVRSVESVVLDEGTSSYISLFSTGVLPATGENMIARYHPSILVPEFRQYRIANVPHEGPYDILAEVQVEFVPLVADDDVIPFPTLEPIKNMMSYQWNLANNETVAAEKYLTAAMTWITRFNSSKNTVQTPVVVNVPYAGSMGNLSNFYANL